ncbi:hypothetical protein [Halospeciosus flavus]|uniref:hypothetical protein n=1 Tax=Halospeciosus flavus TaxID=3032283 RepID=UPI0036171F2F
MATKDVPQNAAKRRKRAAVHFGPPKRVERLIAYCILNGSVVLNSTTTLWIVLVALSKK